MNTAGNYTIENEHGDASGAGVPDLDAAMRAARFEANSTGETRYITGTDDDGDEIVPVPVVPDAPPAQYAEPPDVFRDRW